MFFTSHAVMNAVGSYFAKIWPMRAMGSWQDLTSGAVPAA
jgi:hypothetical protein